MTLADSSTLKHHHDRSSMHEGMGGHEVIAPRDCCVLKAAALRHMEVHSAHFEQFEASSSDFCKCCFAMLPLQRELCSESVTSGLNSNSAALWLKEI